MDRHDEPRRPALSSARPVRAGTRKANARRARDLELEVGARAHFDDPAYYDRTYRARADDVAYYAALAKPGLRVLEYGVGSGRIALPMARAGAQVTGIDHSAPMLGALRARLREEAADVRARVRLVRGDMRRVALDERFPLVICPFNTALHLYERQDVEAWLAHVRRHLTPGGTLVLDVSVPSPSDLARDPTRAHRTAPFVHPSAGKVKYAEHFDYDQVRQILFVSMVFEPIGKPPSASFATPLAHRQFFPREMEALLHYNGFDVVTVHGDFHGGPLDADSDVMIWHARPRARGRR